MKKNKLTWLPAAMMALFVTACSNEENIPGTDGNGSGVITFTVNPDYGVKTRAGIATLPNGKALRCIMEVYDDTSGNIVAGSRKTVTITDASTPIEFTLEKKPGAAYTVAFWADFTATATPENDVYYDTATNGLKEIAFNPSNTDDFNGEAFYGNVAIDDKGTAATTDITLTHAVSMVTLKTTTQLENLKSVKVTYGEAGGANAPMSAFNAVTGALAGTAATVAKVNKVDNAQTPSDGAPYDFHTFYVFAPNDAQSVINMTVEMCTDDAGTTAVETINIPNVPIRANYKTNIKGDYSIQPNTFSIICTAGWSAEELIPLWDGTSGTAVDKSSTFSGGSGTSESDPYIIGTATDLAQLAANVNDGESYAGKYFKLAADIDLNNKEWTPIGNCYDYQDTHPDNLPFQGYFDGGHHKITNLYITSDRRSLGLFGYARCYQNDESPVLIKNIHVSGSISTTTGGNYTGGILGIVYHCDISNCSFEGSINVSSNGYVAGICGYTYICKVSSSKNSGTLAGNNWVAGITAGGEGANCYGCYNTGTLTNTNSNGTLAGITGSGHHDVKYCYNIGEISGPTSYKGGTAQYDGSNSTVENCFATNPYDSDGTTTFGDGTNSTGWPASTGGWTVDPSPDGSTNKYWKSIGSWNGGNPEYPILWWE